MRNFLLFLLFLSSLAVAASLTAAASLPCQYTEEVVINSSIKPIPYDNNGVKLQELVVEFQDDWGKPLIVTNLNNVDLPVYIDVKHVIFPSMWCDAGTFDYRIDRTNDTIKSNSRQEIPVTIGSHNPIYCTTAKWNPPSQVTYFASNDVKIRLETVNTTETRCKQCNAHNCTDDGASCSVPRDCGSGYCVEGICSTSDVCYQNDCKCGDNRVQCSDNKKCVTKNSSEIGSKPICSFEECATKYIDNKTGLCAKSPQQIKDERLAADEVRRQVEANATLERQNRERLAALAKDEIDRKEREANATAEFNRLVLLVAAIIILAIVAGGIYYYKKKIEVDKLKIELANAEVELKKAEAKQKAHADELKAAEASLKTAEIELERAENEKNTQEIELKKAKELRKNAKAGKALNEANRKLAEAESKIAKAEKTISEAKRIKDDASQEMLKATEITKNGVEAFEKYQKLVKQSGDLKRIEEMQEKVKKLSEPQILPVKVPVGPNGVGYKYFRMYLGEKGYWRFAEGKKELISRWVAEKFIYNRYPEVFTLPFDQYETHHIDDYQSNNDYDNLALLTEPEHKLVTRRLREGRTPSEALEEVKTPQPHLNN